MLAQRLKTLNDFLKRAEIIPQALLVITENDSTECVEALIELRALDYEIPFYDLSLSENPNLKNELEKYYKLDHLPTFMYFRGKRMIGQITGFSKSNNFSLFLTTLVHQKDIPN
jgi:thioredoxin-related protein